MLATNYTSLRENMKAYFDQVVDESETLMVTRKDGANVVVVSQDTYNNLIENLHLLGNREMYGWLMESKEQLEHGRAHERELIR